MPSLHQGVGRDYPQALHPKRLSGVPSGPQTFEPAFVGIGAGQAEE
jgi:hypothetical protein